MSEAITIALIGIIPSVLVALVTIISNNAIIKMRLDKLESIAHEYRHYDEEIQVLRHELMDCIDGYFKLKEYIEKVERKKISRGRTKK